MKANIYRKLLQKHVNETHTNSTTEKHENLSITSLFDSSIVIIILILLIALFFIGFFSIYIRRSSDEPPVHRRRIRRTPYPPTSSPVSARFSSSKNVAASAAFRSLAILSYSRDVSKPIDCIICLTEFEEKEKVKMTPCCKHVFHPGCIDTWLSSHLTCPLCRSTKMDAIEDVQRRWAVNEMDTWTMDGAVNFRRTRSLSSLNTIVALQRSNSF
ncbi:RING-H2 finger protein ATL57 [Heracleum sosnowskyi]|uniref:RING-type E3 ubiquitin transferase n=1 Tax=Heracleum sosnowskyi TaxID=360622 RepID=A0AAD8MRT8_9APIA|nr:RING-H2 finger protein ATL57 [Heracleum sosnowskyi]